MIRRVSQDRYRPRLVLRVAAPRGRRWRRSLRSWGSRLAVLIACVWVAVAAVGMAH